MIYPKIKNDEEYQQISNIHEDLINEILKEEDDFVTEHKNHIDDMVKSIKDEISILYAYTIDFRIYYLIGKDVI